jgi:hypothetical protein
MLRALTVLAVAWTLLVVGAPALAATGLDAEVLLVIPDRSGRLPAELRPMRQGLVDMGFSGARVAERRSVRLDVGSTTHVEMGSKGVDLDLLWVRGDQASVRVTPARCRPSVTQVSVGAARFFVTVPPAR